MKHWIKENWKKGLKQLSNGLSIVAILGLIFVWFQIKNAENQFTLLKDQYEKSKSPDILIDYYSDNNIDHPKLFISNVGDKRADSIWISNKFYLNGDDSCIYECDLPRYSYVIYDGSTLRMFDLEANRDTIIEYDPQCFDHYKNCIFEKYGGQLVMQWNVKYYHEARPIRYSKTAYFILNHDDMPLLPQDITGGQNVIEKIMQYEIYGPVRRLACIMGDLALLNHPNYFIIDSTDVAQSLFPNIGHKLEAKTLMINVEDIVIPHSKQGYHAFKWNCENNDTKGKYLVSDTLKIY